LIASSTDACQSLPAAAMVAAGPWQQAAEKRHTSPAQWQDPLLYPLSYGGPGAG